MEDKEKKLTTALVIAGIICLILVGYIVKLLHDRAKYEAILDTACTYSGNAAYCVTGIEMLKKMDIDTIRKWGK